MTYGPDTPLSAIPSAMEVAERQRGGDAPSDRDLALQVWQVERREQLESDPAELIDALRALSSADDALVDLVDALYHKTDKLAEAERALTRWIDFVMIREEALGRWEAR